MAKERSTGNPSRDSEYMRRNDTNAERIGKMLSNASIVNKQASAARTRHPDRPGDSKSALYASTSQHDDRIGVSQRTEPTANQENEVNEIEANGLTDEAAAIEHRRRRREALKSKYRSQATPLLLQALHTGTNSDSAMSSPAPLADDVGTSQSKHVSLCARYLELTSVDSPAPSSPASPRPVSDPQSPAELVFEQVGDFANEQPNSPGQDAGDEPSAADYDPTVDMQQERARHDRRMFKEDDASLEKADEQAINHALAKEATLPESSLRTKDEFDMFAEDDDEGGFELPIDTKSKSAGGTGKALDVAMMDNWDDPEGYYNTIPGELIQDRYHITQNLGRGMFSSVVRASDGMTGQPVAIKIIRNNEVMKKAGIKEIDILKDLALHDLEDKKHLIRLLGSFEHKGHLCMVFENLSLNLREVLKKFGRDVGLNIKAIRAYAQQLFLGLSLLRKCQYLHADLKPDNILVNEARSLVKICDLGSASPISENGTAPYLVSRFYRAPEIILGISYDYAIDMWSIGCTLFELYTGKILFTGRNNNGMLRAIMECRGKFPHKLLRRGTIAHEYFDDLLQFQTQEYDKVTGRSVTKMIEIKAKPLKDLRSRLLPRGKRMDDQERKEVELLVDLLDKCLDLRPEKRITPLEALKHPFILRPKA